MKIENSVISNSNVINTNLPKNTVEDKPNVLQDMNKDIKDASIVAQPNVDVTKVAEKGVVNDMDKTKNVIDPSKTDDPTKGQNVDIYV